MTNCIERTSTPLTVALLALSLAACTVGPAKRSSASTALATPVRAAPTAEVAATDQTKGDPDQRFQEALALMKARRTPEAQAAFIALSRDYPNFSGPLTDLGILYAQTHQRELAVASLTRAVAANPNNEVAHNWLGTLHRENGDFLRAEQSYQRALQAKPDYAQAHLNIAILYDVALHRPREALGAYRSYQRIAGNDDLIVDAWIRDLESRLQTAPAPTKVAEVRP